MPKATPTRTFGPLHHEDLEPHRFEDLVRQLVYDFRPWRRLEATGRTGSDTGFDARAWEMVGVVEALESDEGVEEIPPAVNDRLWLIQCKREKEIGPRKIVKYLGQIPANEGQQLYGIIFAAACDFSIKTREAFRERCRAADFAEWHLWGKGEIEDMLFQPKNDHLLFAYFGISLQARRRSLKTDVRARLAMKRKAQRILGHRIQGEVLVRDASDDRYPRLDPDKSKRRTERGRWKLYTVEGCFHDGVRLKYRRQFAFVDDDGQHWDFAETMNDADPSPFRDAWQEEDPMQVSADRQEAQRIWEELPERNRGWLEMTVVLSYDRIVDIDEDGDEIVQEPHIYTDSWDPESGPFERASYMQVVTIDRPPRCCEPREEARVKKFPRPTEQEGMRGPGAPGQTGE